MTPELLTLPDQISTVSVNVYKKVKSILSINYKTPHYHINMNTFTIYLLHLLQFTKFKYFFCTKIDWIEYWKSETKYIFSSLVFKSSDLDKINSIIDEAEKELNIENNVIGNRIYSDIFNGIYKFNFNRPKTTKKISILWLLSKSRELKDKIFRKPRELQNSLVYESKLIENIHSFSFMDKWYDKYNTSNNCCTERWYCDQDVEMFLECSKSIRMLYNAVVLCKDSRKTELFVKTLCCACNTFVN